MYFSKHVFTNKVVMKITFFRRVVGFIGNYLLPYLFYTLYN